MADPIEEVPPQIPPDPAAATAAPSLPAPPVVDTTKLSPAEEAKYQTWRDSLPPRLQYEGDYDLRGFYKKNPTFSVDSPGQHMTDEFKLPNHDTFSNESRYYNEKTAPYGGKWVQRPNDGPWSFMANDPTKKRSLYESAQGDRTTEQQAFPDSHMEALKAEIHARLAAGAPSYAAPPVQQQATTRMTVQDKAAIVLAQRRLAVNPADRAAMQVLQSYGMGR